MKTLNVGVIGVGRMGQHHCRVYSSLKQVQFVGVFDVDRNIAENVAQRFEVTAFRTIDELLDQVDAVSVTTPTPCHFDIVMDCLERGIHVLVEKPFTETLAQADMLVRAGKSGDTVIQVGHIERFNPTFLELKNVLETMPVLAMNFRRLSPFQGSNKDVDVVLDLMIHDLDLVLDLFAGEPHSMSAYGLVVLSNTLDHAVAQLCYTPQPLINITASRITEQKIRCIDVTVGNAYLEIDLLNKNILIHRRSVGEYLSQNHHAVKYRQESIVERILVPNSEPLLLEIQHFLDCIMNHTPCRVGANEGLRSLALALEIRNMICEFEGHQVIPAHV
jgi:predicted dehydrogenase